LPLAFNNLQLMHRNAAVPDTYAPITINETLCKPQIRKRLNSSSAARTAVALGLGPSAKNQEMRAGPKSIEKQPREAKVSQHVPPAWLSLRFWRGGNRRRDQDVSTLEAATSSSGIAQGFNCATTRPT